MVPLAGCQQSPSTPAPPQFESGPASWSPGSLQSDTTDWPVGRHDPHNSGSNPKVTAPEPPLEPRWTAPIEESQPKPVVTDERVIVPSSAADGPVIAFDRQAGDRLWQAESGRSQSTAPAVGGDTLYGLEDVTDSTQVILTARDVETGTTKWTSEASPWSFDIAFDGTTVYVFGKTLLALEATNGERVWNFNPGSRQQWVTSIAVDDQHLYVAASNDTYGASDTAPPRGKVFALDPTGERIEWSVEFTQPKNLGLGGERLLVADLETLYALDPTTGDEQWQVPLRPNDTEKLRETPPFAVADGTVYHQTTPKSTQSGIAIDAVALTDGTGQAHYELGYPEAPPWAPAFAIGGRYLYALTQTTDAHLDVVDLAEERLHDSTGGLADDAEFHDGESLAVVDGVVFLGGNSQLVALE
jgi:outer membrane protein assembly factor BamB